MDVQTLVALAVGTSGAIAAIVAVVANRQVRRSSTAKAVAETMAVLVENLREQLDAETARRRRLGERVTQLEQQLAELAEAHHAALDRIGTLEAQLLRAGLVPHGFDGPTPRDDH